MRYEGKPEKKTNRSKEFHAEFLELLKGWRRRCFSSGGVDAILDIRGAERQFRALVSRLGLTEEQCVGSFCEHYANFKSRHPVGSAIAARSAAHSTVTTGNSQLNANVHIPSNAKQRSKVTPVGTPGSYATANDYGYGHFADHATPDRRNDSFAASEQAIYTPATAVHSAPVAGGSLGAHAADYGYGYDAYDAGFESAYGGSTGRSAPGDIQQELSQAPDLHGYYGDSMAHRFSSNSNSKAS